MLKYVSVLLAFNILAEICFPTIAWALTGGPSQPEVQSFEPVGTTEMVDLFSGDFVYNIPLLDVEGYPINISYHSGITMDQEASWVGLGWNINPGSITRNMRGLPDDFAGDAVQKDLYMKPNYTFGINFGVGVEMFGVKKIASAGVGLNYSKGIFYNSYRGVGFQRSFSMSANAGLALLPGNLASVNANARLSITENSQSGTSIQKGTSYGANITYHEGRLGYSVNSSEGYNSRSGIKTLSQGSGFSFYAAKTHTGSVGSSGISYSSQTYIPNIQVPMSTFNATARFTAGGDVVGIHPNFGIDGYISVQSIKQSDADRSYGAYGYLYAEKSKKYGNDALMDLNREKDAAYTTNAPSLPIASHTYDIYAISGQGVGGMYRPHRGDIGVLFDNQMSTRKDNAIPDINVSVETGYGNFVHFGSDLTLIDASVTTGRWNDCNMLGSAIDFIDPDKIADPLYEPAYFKVAGEKTPVIGDFAGYLNLNEAVAPQLSSAGSSYCSSRDQLKMTPVEGQNQFSISQANMSKSRRDKRSQQIRYLTVAQSAYCSTRKIPALPMNTFYNYGTSIDSLPRSGSSNETPLHHISEVSVLNTSGTRYVYGIPAYNHSQQEYIFTAGSGGDLTTGLVEYNPDIVSKKRGVEDDNRDGFYSATKLPKYAHSYLLTSVLSPDYVDVNQNGPDAADLGSYTKINYTKANNDYRWRVPYNANKANYQAGNFSDPFDDKGNILYGAKEMWYVHTIETKNYVAEFTLKRREDALGTIDVHGGKQTDARSYRIETIALYTKAERAKGSKAVPVKTVHFEYDYSLCPNVDNNTNAVVDKDGVTTTPGPANVNANKGKLTLRKIYFTYGNSKKGKFSTYDFHYNADRNAARYNNAYSIKGYDRWGNYKPNTGTPTNAEAPYVLQDTALTNAYTQQWTLDKIDLPSGGAIQVQYESDDYAYVQNRRAMQMMKVAGFSSTNDYNSKTTDLYSPDAANTYLFLDLPVAVADKQEFISEYLSGIKDLFFNFYVAMGNGTSYEYIRGYVEFDTDAGDIVPGSGGTKAWIKIKNVGFGNDGSDANPISKASWQYARLNAPYLVYPESDLRRNPVQAPKTALRWLVGIGFDLSEIQDNINEKLKNRSFGKTVDLSRSFIRLNNPNKKKLGGGLRVKRLTLTDNWSGMTGGTSSEYGQEYDYTIKESYRGGERTVSSGVASYEPMIGNEENPFRLPLSYSKQNYLIPDDRFYIEEPFGEMFFPGAGIGYSSVTVRNIRYANVNAHATGRVVNEFYTAKDFPTITKQTEIDHVGAEPSITGSLFYSESYSNLTVSKGYLIELNDMHGKPKAVWTYAEPDPNDANARDKLVSGIQYVYKTDVNNKAHLNNEVKVVASDRTITSATIGVDVDLYSDAREEASSTRSGGVQFNVETFFMVPTALVLPIALPSAADDNSYFRSMTITKVIQRYGLLEKTIAYQEGATISTFNEAYDAETGDVLLTRTQNEFRDNIYNVSYPAHWTYNRMGPAYKNEGVVIKNATMVDPGPMSNHFTLPSGLIAKNYFAKGDEVRVTAPGIDRKYWIGDEGDGADGVQAPYLMDIDGPAQIPLGTVVTIEVLRSGRRNMMGLPVLQATALNEPVSGTTTQKLTLETNSRIINSQASEYSEDWRNNCEITSVPTTVQVRGNKPLQVFNIYKYLLTSNQLTDSFRYTTYPYDTVQTPINRTLPGYLSYDTSFIYYYQQASGKPHVFNERLRYNQPANPQLDKTVMYNILLAQNQYSFTMLYQDTGCISTSVSKKPIDIEYLGFGGEDYLGSGYINGELYVKLVFGPGCSINTKVLMEHIPLYDTVYTINTCRVLPATIPNPYLAGTQGNWRKKKDVVYLDERTNASAKTNIRTDGYYKTYEPYWDNSVAGTWQTTANTATKWTMTSEVTNYSPDGMLIESRDALDRYAAVLYRSNLGSGSKTQPVAVANNAKLRQIGNEGFEDYGYGNVDDYAGTCPLPHWNFFQSDVLYIDTTQYHTGKRSLKLTTSQEALSENSIFKPDNYADAYACKECVIPFYPDSGRYVISAWIKTDAAKTDLGNRKGSIEVTYGGNTQRDILRPSGPIIEGWQRVEGTVYIAQSAKNIKVVLKPSATETTWFDDIRIHPFSSSMKSFVYDFYTLKLASELDENNYATFYEYDEQGAVKRVKRETEKGIVTVKETRSSNIKK